MKKAWLLIFFLLYSLNFLSGQVFFSFKPDEKYRVIERSDYRIRENGSYKGHIYKENRGILKAELQTDGSYMVSGDYYVFEELTRGGSRSASKVNEINQSSFTLFTNGQMLTGRDLVYPLLRSFPSYTDEAMVKGETWLAFSEKVVLREETVTRFPVYCEYVYEGPGQYKGEDSYSIQAKYAIRYNHGDDPDGDPLLKSISGTHDVTLIISAETGEPILIRDNMKEFHSYTNGNTLEKNGFILTFFKGVTGLDKAGIAERLKEELKQNLGDNLARDVALEDREDGLLLTLKNLHFLPDKAVLLPQDIPLLDLLADSLKTIENRSFLVKGHTADVGSSESQFELSINRSLVVVRELIERGIPEDRILYMGMGGTEPVAANNTEAGRASNRRVEILIMED